jgi:hypothetical protein
MTEQTRIFCSAQRALIEKPDRERYACLDHGRVFKTLEHWTTDPPSQRIVTTEKEVEMKLTVGPAR